MPIKFKIVRKVVNIGVVPMLSITFFKITNGSLISIKEKIESLQVRIIINGIRFNLAIQ